MWLYTKRGDSGMTDLIGARVRKSHPRVDAYGAVDELNAVLGMVRSVLDDKQLASKVERIQRDLFALGAELATSPNTPPPLKLSYARLKALERQIDSFQAEVPTPRHFVLPGGSLAAALVHLARTVCRRAERRVVALAEQEPVRPLVVKYLNRLSDWLFAFALVVNKRRGEAEILWEGRQKRLGKTAKIDTRR